MQWTHKERPAQVALVNGVVDFLEFLLVVLVILGGEEVERNVHVFAGGLHGSNSSSNERRECNRDE